MSIENLLARFHNAQFLTKIIIVTFVSSPMILIAIHYAKKNQKAYFARQKAIFDGLMAQCEQHETKQAEIDCKVLVRLQRGVYGDE